MEDEKQQSLSEIAEVLKVKSNIEMFVHCITHLANQKAKNKVAQEDITLFWQHYEDLTNVLKKAFPVGKE